ncbi:MAG TPA: DALR anticodon-binding domain-containing protein, partial [Stellaceae bacterium]|nr:DALR anticodon-binding domain-containing protein [Stellaceae bacterium]
RLKVHLREVGTRHDLIAAVFGDPRAPGVLLPSEMAASIKSTLIRSGTIEDDLVRLLIRVDALRSFLGTDDGANLLTAYRRASNIVSIEERRDGRGYDLGFVVDHLQMPEEKVLGEQLEQVSRAADDLLLAEDFDEAMAQLATLRKPVDEFFDRVTVNVPDKQLRENRLRLLARIRATMNQIADFSQIEG